MDLRDYLQVGEEQVPLAPANTYQGLLMVTRPRGYDSNVTLASVSRKF
jgi:hypothetical protein